MSCGCNTPGSCPKCTTGTVANDCKPPWPPEQVDPTVCQECLINPCCCDRQTKQFTQLKGSQISEALIPDLGDVVDDIRDLYTELGARPYEVTLVWTQWSGGARDVGVEQVVRQCPLLPTPKVSDVSTLNKEVFSIGNEETGSIRVSEISPRFTEDQLVGNSNDGDALPTDMNFYYEVFFPRARGPGVRRRFTVDGTPNYNPTKFQWWVNLRRAYEDRSRDGSPNG